LTIHQRYVIVELKKAKERGESFSEEIRKE
jgi:hypothetical protein